VEDLNTIVLVLAIAIWISITWKMKKWSTSLRIGGLILIAIVLLMVKYGPGWANSDRIFQLSEARTMGQDIDRVVDKGSVIFATKPMANYLALFSNSYSIRPFEIERIGVKPLVGLRRLLKRGVKLYLADTSGWKRDATKAIPGFREYFDVVQVGKLAAEKYNLYSNFGKPNYTSTRLSPGRRKKQS
jgi:hypothetical protein